MSLFAPHSRKALLTLALLVAAALAVALARRAPAPDRAALARLAEEAGLQRAGVLADSPAEPGPLAAAPAGAEAAPKAGEPGATGEEDPERQLFGELLARTLTGLPRAAEARALPAEETHHPGRWLLAAGRDLGLVAETLRAHPELRALGARFYRDCAASGELLPAVRAVCLRGLLRLGARDEEVPEVPAEVVELAREISG